MSDIYAVIMAGGAGTRFWPASRHHRPKQLLPLASPSGEPLVATSVRRILPLCPPERVFVVTALHLTGAMRAALPDLPAENFLAEPAARNTAPCIAWANAVIQARDPEAKVMVLAADHFIADEDGFRKTVRTALDAADSSNVVTIGITPTRPETGYGYIEKGPAQSADVFAVERFVEKPNAERALTYITSGNHLWNSGMFFFRVSAMSKLIAQHLPELAHGLAEMLSANASPAERANTIARIFPKLPSVSVDTGIMERAQGITVVPGSFGWSDVGSWQSSWELSPKDPEENAAPANALLIDSHANLVSDLREDGRGRERLIALIGVDNLAVVVTDDVVLVIPRDRAQDVRKAVDVLKSRGAVDKL